MGSLLTIVKADYSNQQPECWWGNPGLAARLLLNERLRKLPTIWNHGHPGPANILFLPYHSPVKLGLMKATNINNVSSEQGVLVL